MIADWVMNDDLEVGPVLNGGHWDRLFCVDIFRPSRQSEWWGNCAWCLQVTFDREPTAQAARVAWETIQQSVGHSSEELDWDEGQLWRIDWVDYSFGSGSLSKTKSLCLESFRDLVDGEPIIYNSVIGGFYWDKYTSRPRRRRCRTI